MTQERFEVLKILGEGGCGTVYHVKDRNNNGQELALKVLTNIDALDKFTRERFIKEVLILCSIDHRNIVRAYELLTYEGKEAYTMEYIDGKDLGSYFIDGTIKQLQFDDIESIIRQLLLALKELHSRDIIHRDIKPENIMMNKDGVVKLNDLGYSKFLKDDPKTDPGLLLGTVYYVAPEYYVHKSVDPRSDIYACGVILWELLSGKRRMIDGTAPQVLTKIAENKFAHPKLHLKGEGAKYNAILAKALAYDREDRFQSAEEMYEAFDDSIQARLMIQMPRERSAIPLLIATAALVFLCGIPIFFYLF